MKNAINPRIRRQGPFLVDDLKKAPTGIAGLDRITGGGLPCGLTTLIEGGPGSGKTVLALQTIVNGARLFNEPGIFVAFEERSTRLIANASRLGWDLKALQRKKLFFLDAHVRSDLVIAGGFDFAGMLAILAAKADEMGAKRIVFDAVDVVLTLLNDPQIEQREIYRLNEWLLERDMTSMITCKRTEAGTILEPLGFMQFMVDCSVILRHDVVQSVSQRSLRVLKYRGSAFEENESPFLIGRNGLDVADTWLLDRNSHPVSNKRVSSGVRRLDSVLGGGYFEGSSVLITGAPGTAKSTLGGAFAQAACRYGYRTLVVSYDMGSSQYVRNLASVNIRLDRFETNGMLQVASSRTVVASAETHLMHIKSLAESHRARCVVIDPASALSQMGNALTASSVAERLVDWAKASGITLLCTSLLDRPASELESTPLQISTLADTWIHLSYQVRAGERNRGLSVIKSRGTAHSNQVRELILESKGVTLADAYAAGGEVLMGTLRWEREREARIVQSEGKAVLMQKEIMLRAAEAELEGRIESLQREAEAKRIERKALTLNSSVRQTANELDRLRMRELRGSDAPTPKRR
jgi:circadian clock protein KaiC